MKKVKKKALLVTLITLTSVLIDQLTKIIVFSSEGTNWKWNKNMGFFKYCICRKNRGISFGIFF